MDFSRGCCRGSVIHNYVPQEMIQSVVGKAVVFFVPIAVVIFQKGMFLGTALSFMMTISALSLSSGITLRRVMKLKLIAMFFGITAVGIIFTGYMFNFFQHILA